MKIEAIIGKIEEAIMNFEKVISSTLFLYNYNLLSLSLSHAHKQTHRHTRADVHARRYKPGVFGLYRLD